MNIYYMLVDNNILFLLMEKNEKKFVYKNKIAVKNFKWRLYRWYRKAKI